MIAVDSSSFIAFFKNEKGEDIDKLAEAIRSRQLIIPGPVVAEVLCDPQATVEVEEVIKSLRILDVSSGFWLRVAKTRAKILGKSLKARLADTIIAQLCIDSNIPLITRDHDYRHFIKYSGLVCIGIK